MGKAEHELHEHIRDLVDEVAQVTHADVSKSGVVIRDGRESRALMHHLWDLLLSAMTRPEGAAPAPLVVPLLARIRDIEHAIAERELLHGTELLKQVRSQLAALRGSRTVDDLFGRATVAMNGLGFDRSLLSIVDDKTWRLHSMHVEGDSRWAEEILAVGRESPPVLDAGIVEHDALVLGDAVLVQDVQQNPRVNGPLATITRSDSYGIAPLALDGHVIGLVHGDCYHQRRRLGKHERALLALFAEGLSHALGRVVVLERLEALRAGLADLSIPIPAPAPPAPAAPSTAEDSHALLTRRESEIMQLLSNGDSNRLLARRLSITEGTAKCHVTSILRKLGAANRAEAVSIWLRSR